MIDLTEDDAVAGFAALGHHARLQLLRLLVRAGHDGATVGDLGRLAGIPASTLAHHLAALVRAGLVRQSRRSREVLCTADFERVSALAGHLTEACCTGLEVPATAEAAPAACCA